MRNFIATPFFVLAWVVGGISATLMGLACAIQGITVSEYLEDKVEGLNR